METFICWLLRLCFEFFLSKTRVKIFVRIFSKRNLKNFDKVCTQKSDYEFQSEEMHDRMEILITLEKKTEKSFCSSQTNFL